MINEDPIDRTFNHEGNGSPGVGSLAIYQVSVKHLKVEWTGKVPSYVFDRVLNTPLVILQFRLHCYHIREI